MSDQRLVPTGDVSPPSSPSFDVRVNRHHLVDARGELDITTAPQFARTLSPLVNEGGVVCIDFSALDFCGAAGINVLFRALRTLGTRGRIVIYDPTPSVSRVIALTELDHVVDVVCSRHRDVPATPAPPGTPDPEPRPG